MKKYYIFFLFYFLIANAYGQITEEEFQALKAIYNSTGGSNWTKKTGWTNINTTSTKDDVNSTWFGITVQDGHVTRLYMNSNNMVGYLPPQIGFLKWVSEFSVSNNKLEGLVPQSIGDMTSLKNLSLSSNGFISPLPETLAHLEQLESIYLTNNPLNYPFPNDLFENIPTIRRIDAENCGFTDTIADIFGSIPLLYGLILSNNKITGVLPKSINNLKLSELHLGRNKLSGPLPRLDSSKNTIYYLTLNENNFSDTFPVTYGEFKILKYLHVNGNKLTGAINPGIFTTIFTRLYIQQNYFTFAGIEPIYNELSNLFQKSFNQNKLYPLKQNEVIVNEGASLVLNAKELSHYELGGNNNRYKWYLNDTEIYAGNDPTYTVANASAINSGIYWFEVTNLIVTELKLKSEIITVSVLVPGNHPPTDILLNKNYVNENYAGQIATISTTDIDNDDTHYYTLAKGNGENDKDNELFNISGNNLTLNSMADYESKQKLNLFLNVNDLKGGIFSKAITIDVLNIDEAPVFEGQITKATIDETVPNNFVVLYLRAKDPENSPVQFSIISGNENGAFAIDIDRLIVNDNTQLNYDQKNQYIMNIAADDGLNSVVLEFKITLSKINKMPVVESSTFQINENSPKGTLAGSIVAYDPEGYPLMYSLAGGNYNETFRLDGNQIFVQKQENLDYELNPAFELTINVSDGISNVQAIIFVNLNNLPDETGNEILTFTFDGILEPANINSDNRTITARIFQRDVTKVIPYFTISKGATSEPATGTLMDFSTSRIINITSEIGEIKAWTVNLTDVTSNNDLNKANIVCFPNPVDDIMTIQGLKEVTVLFIYSFDGKIVFQKKLYNPEETISLDNISSGLYFAVLSAKSGKAVIPLIKN